MDKMISCYWVIKYGNQYLGASDQTVVTRKFALKFQDKKFACDTLANLNECVMYRVVKVKYRYIRCNWTNIDIDDETVQPQQCTEQALFTTCDPIHGVVCEKHRCRCSKPLNSKQTHP